MAGRVDPGLTRPLHRASVTQGFALVDQRARDAQAVVQRLVGVGVVGDVFVGAPAARIIVIEHDDDQRVPGTAVHVDGEVVAAMQGLGATVRR